MSFLQDLKRQASVLRAPPAVDPEVIERNVRLAHGACRVTRDYWLEMVEQLNVITPPSVGRYVVDGRRPLEDLRCTNFRVAAQARRDAAGEERFEAVTVAWQAASGRRARIEKDFPTDIERVRAALHQAGIPAHEATLLHEVSGRPVGTAFEFTADVNCSVRLVPLPDSGRVRLVFTNVDQLERVEAEFPAVGMRPRQLDEIGRWIVGQPHRVLEYADNVRRFVP